MPKKTFKVGDDIYDIDDNEVSDFIHDMPDAKEVKSYKVGQDTFDIELADIDDFLKDMPEAVPLGEDVKKKPSSGVPSVPSIGYSTTALGSGQPRNQKTNIPFVSSTSKSSGTVPEVPKRLTPEQLRDQIAKSTARVGKAENTPTPILRLEEFNKVNGTNFTPEQIANRVPLPEPVNAAEAAGREFLAGTNDLFAATMNVPRYLERTLMNPILEIAGMPEEAKQAFFAASDANPANPLKGFNAIADYYKSDAQKIREPLKGDYDESVTKLIGEGDYLGAAKQAGVQLAGSLPATLGIAAAAASGMPLAAITPVGGTVFGSQNYQSIDPNSEMTETQKQASSFGKGVAEGLFEQLGTGSIAKNAFKIIEKEGAEKAVKVVADQYTTAIKEALKTYLPVTAPIQEGLTEAATTLAQNTIDKLVDPGKKDINVMDGVADSFVLGGVMGTAFGAAPTVVNSVRNLTNKPQAQEIETKLAEIDNDLDNDAIPDETKQLLADERAKVLTAANDLIEKDRQEYNALDDAQQDAVDDITQKVQQIDAALADEGLSETSKEALQNQKVELEKQYKEVFTPPVQGYRPKNNGKTEEKTQESEQSETNTNEVNGSAPEQVVEEAVKTTLTPADQKLGSIIPRSEAVDNAIKSNPETEEIKNTLVNAGKVVLDEEGKVVDVKQNSGESSQLYKDLSSIAGDKSVGLDEYLKRKDDKGSFKARNTDWENGIMKEYGQKGLEYAIKRGKPEGADESQFYWTQKDKNGKLEIIFNDAKSRRQAEFPLAKQEYREQVIDPMVENATGADKKALEEYRDLYDKNVNKTRDLKFVMIHEALINESRGGVKPADLVDSIKEVGRLAHIPLAKDYYGEPLVVMHAGPEGITKFRKPGDKGYKANDPLTGNAGIYFSRDLNQGGKYAGLSEGKPAEGKDIYYTHLKTENPYYITDKYAQSKYPLKDSVTLTEKDVQELKKLGYDSVIWDKPGEPKYEVVVFEPDQVEIIGSYRKGLIDINESTKDAGAKTTGTDDMTALQKELKKMGAPDKLIAAIPKDTKLREGFLTDNKRLKESILGLAGQYDAKKNEIRIGKLHSFFKGRDYIMIHEAVHAATMITMGDIYNNPQDYTKEQVEAAKELADISIEYLMNTSVISKIAFPLLYGTTNQYEFVAEFISNKKFREWVGKNAPSQKNTIISHIWSKILTVLGLSKKQIDQNRIDNIQNLVDKSLEASRDRLERKDAKENSKETTPDQQTEGILDGEDQGKREEKRDVLTQEAGVDQSAPALPEEEKARIEKLGTDNKIDGGFRKVINTVNKYLREITDETANTITDNDVSAALKNKEEGKVRDGYVPPVKQTNSKTEEGEAPGRELRVAKRALESDRVEDAVKEGIRRNGTTYIPISLKITKQEAVDYVDAFEKINELDVAYDNVLDYSNGMSGLVRASIGAELFKRYTQKAKDAQTIEDKTDNEKKAARILASTAVQLKNAGQEINAGKIWKELISSTPEGAIMDLQRQYNERNNAVIAADINNISDARKFLEEYLLSEEGKKVIEEKVGEEIDKRSEQLFSKEQKSQIVNFFDSLLIDTKNRNFDATLGLPVAVWNGAVKAMKNAVLLGANTANAIKAGVEFIKSNHTGVFDEKHFELTMKKQFKGLNTKRKITPTPKQEKTILDEWAKKLGKLKPENRKKLLANSIAELNREGALSDDRFRDLYAEALGLDVMTDELKIKINDLINTINEAEKTGDEYKKTFEKDGVTDGELNSARRKWERSVRSAREANESLSELFREKKNVWRTLSTILQGGLLTPMSLITNVYSNVLLQPLRFMSGGVSTLADYILSQGAKYTALSKYISPERSFDLLTRSKGAWKGFIPGIKESYRDIRYGITSQEINKRDLQTKLDPYKSLANLWYAYIKRSKSLSATETINDAIEGTIGILPDLFFRFLGAGDKPFRNMAEAGKAYELGVQKGLEGRALEQFMAFPDEVSAEEIQRAGDESTFQEDNVISTGMNKLEKLILSKSGFFSFVYKSIFPYVKTPTNILGETVMYALPEVALLTSLMHAKKGDKKRALKYFGVSVTGAMIQYVAYQIIAMGLLTPPAGDDDKKEKSIKYENIPPGSLNISALGRLMSGQSGGIQDNDSWINIQKMGVLGTVLLVHADVLKNKIEGEAAAIDYLDRISETLPTVAKVGLEQSFLQGANTIMNSISHGGSYADRFLISMVNTISSVAYPNTLSLISRTSDIVLRETRDEKFWQQLKNVFNEKMFMGDKLPAKITLWGEKISNAPEGRNKWLYGLFDVTKYRNVDADNFGYKIFEKYVETKDADWVPPIPQDKVTINDKKIKLSAKQLETFQGLVGKERAKLVSQYVLSSTWETDNDEMRLKELKYLYDEGYANGRQLLIDVDPEINKVYRGIE